MSYPRTSSLSIGNYFNRYGGVQDAELRLHVDHCLLSLKNMIECRADAAPVVLQDAGSDSKVGAWTLRDPPKHCKNYNVLQTGYKDRTLCPTHCNADEIYNGKSKSL